MHGKKVISFVGSIITLGLVYFFSLLAPRQFAFLQSNSEHDLLMTFFEIGCLFVLSFIVFYCSHITRVPSFIIAIFFGIAGHNLLLPIVQAHTTLGALVGFGATLILFGGGLETPFHNFKKLLPKIISLSFFGLLLTAFLFSGATIFLSRIFGNEISLVVAVLLGAVLASTDPAAIIPVLKHLRFFNRSTKDIVVSESAVTDVTGTLLTVAFLGVIATKIDMPSLVTWYGSIFTATSGMILAKQLVYGIIFGVLGYGFLEILSTFKKGHEREFEADAAFFLFIPVIIFTIALALGGSGYLAAFIAGLLFNLNDHLHETERFFNHIIEGFFKPAIFILLGALVEPHELLAYAGVGIVAAFVFMVIIRPIAVLVTLAPFSFFGKDRFSLRELLFISFVRETGAIPAVLLITVTSAGIGNVQGLVPVGMWVILLTLIVEPMLTTAVAKKLKIAEEIKDHGEVETGTDPVVILGTRGRSFIHRLPFVSEWAMKRGIERVLVMLCLEDNYAPKKAQEIEKEAQATFKKINDDLRSSGGSEIIFEFMSRRGFLQKNIHALASRDSSVVAFFVGRKMLDFRMKEIKKLRLPIYFID